MHGNGQVSKRDVLRMIGKRTRNNQGTSFRTLEEELWLSADAACSHLKRLWRERLIKSTEYPSDYQEATSLRPSIRDLRFQISRRGIERLDRWKELEKGDGWLL